MALLSRLLIVCGLILIFFALLLFYQRNNPSRISFADYAQAQSKSRSEIFPTRVQIERVGIDLPLYPSEIVNGKWGDTKKGASYLLTSPVPGEDGNSVIYAHNYPVLFGSLTKTVVDDTVTITYSDGTSKKFVIVATKIVDPTDTGVIGKSPEKRLTLYTCTGFLDSKRFVVSAIPI